MQYIVFTCIDIFIATRDVNL